MKKIKGYDLIYKVIVGSHSHGTNLRGSDTDIKGVFIQSPEDVLENGVVSFIEISKDEVYFEVGKFLDLCVKANPTILEMLYVSDDCILHEHFTFQKIREIRSMFLTKACRASFVGYALEQIKKAKNESKYINWTTDKTQKKNILDFCFVHQGTEGTILKGFLNKYGLNYEDVALSKISNMKNCYALYIKFDERYENFNPKGVCENYETSTDLLLSEIPRDVLHEESPYLLYYDKDLYVKHCLEYKKYQVWLSEYNKERYNNEMDCKNMMHCVRLVESACEIPVLKRLIVKRPNPHYLISIKKGQVNLKELSEKCEKNIERANKLFEMSTLPEEVNPLEVKQLLRMVRKYHQDNKTTKNHY